MSRDTNGEFASGGGNEESKIPSVHIVLGADSQAVSLGYKGVSDMMAQVKDVDATRISAIHEGSFSKCKAHEAVAVIAQNKPFDDCEGMKSPFSAISSSTMSRAQGAEKTRPK